MYFYLCVAAVAAAILGVSLYIVALLRSNILAFHIGTCVLCLFFMAGIALLALGESLADLNIPRLAEAVGSMLELIGVVSLAIFSILGIKTAEIKIAQDTTSLIVWSSCVTVAGLATDLICSGVF